MKLSATIKLHGDPQKLYAMFEPEIADDKRSDFRLIKKKDHLLFEIEADDSVALRATLNSITKLITAYENTIKA